MTKLRHIIPLLFLALSLACAAQTLDTDALAEYPAAIQRQVFEVAQYAKLTGEQQRTLAEAIKKENKIFADAVKANGGALIVKSRNKLNKSREATLASILDREQLEQYYRGVYDAEADAEGNRVADMLQKKYNLTDQNWKFIRVAFYKAALESKVIRKVMADSPKKAEKRIAEVRAEQMRSIEEKGGLRVNPDMTITWLREFDPNKLHR